MCHESLLPHGVLKETMVTMDVKLNSKAIPCLFSRMAPHIYPPPPPAPPHTHQNSIFQSFVPTYKAEGSETMAPGKPTTLNPIPLNPKP